MMKIVILRSTIWVGLLDGYAEKGGHHLNVNVFAEETLLDAQSRKVPPADRVRVSGYAVNQQAHQDGTR